MPKSFASSEESEAWVQLATRIPKALHHRLKLHCVSTDTSVMSFVVAAIEARLAAQTRRGRRAA